MIRTLVGLAFATVVVAGEAPAQIDLSVLDRGKAVEQVDVSALLDEGKVVLATTSATGQVTLPATTFQEGERVYVYAKRCVDGEVEIILSRSATDDPCVDDDAQAGQDCDCDDPIGFFLWGDGPVTIDVGTGTVTQTTAGGAAGNVFKIGAGLNLRYMHNMEDVLNEVPGGSNASATTWAPGFQLLGEYLYRNLFAIGIDAGYSRMETEITFPAGVQTGDLNYYEVGINAKLGLPTTGRVWPYVTGALHRTWNKADFEIDGLSDHRVHKTRRDGLGVGADLRLRPGWDLRIEGLYSSTFEDHDSDEHIRLKFALLYVFGGGYRVMTQQRGGLYE